MHDQATNTVISLYVVKRDNGNYFAGFDTNSQQAIFVDLPLKAKLFTNKYDVRLRPDEKLVELSFDVSAIAPTVSEPFRPHRRKLEPR